MRNLTPTEKLMAERNDLRLALEAIQDVLIEFDHRNPLVATLAMFARNGLAGLPLFDDDHDTDEGGAA